MSNATTSTNPTANPAPNPMAKRRKSAIISGAPVVAIAPEDIIIPKRLGFLHEDKAAALGRLMAMDGQRDPIKVRRNKDGQLELVTGMHRLMGALREGIDVLTLEVEGTPTELAELEASENLHRRELGPLERAKFTAALVHAAQKRLSKIHGDVAQQKIASDARWNQQKVGEIKVEQALDGDTGDACLTMRHAYGWEESVCDAMDMGRATIHRDLTLSRLIIEPFPDLAEKLAHHPVVGENRKQLMQIAGVQNELDRRLVIEALLDNPELSADEARVSAGIDRPKVESDPAMKLVSRAIDTLGRMNDAERDAFIAERVFAMGKIERRRIYDKLAEEFGNAR